MKAPATQHPVDGCDSETRCVRSSFSFRLEGSGGPKDRPPASDLERVRVHESLTDLSHPAELDRPRVQFPRRVERIRSVAGVGGMNFELLHQYPVRPTFLALDLGERGRPGYVSQARVADLGIQLDGVTDRNPGQVRVVAVGE